MKFLSQITSATSGSVNGLTAAHNRGGRYFRARVIPTNPSTARQMQTRSFLTTAATQWTTLATAVIRNAWNLYATNVPVTNPLGEAIQLSGQQWFIAATSFALDADQSDLTLSYPLAAPTIFDRGSLNFEDATLGVGGGLAASILGTAIGGAAGSAIQVQMGRPQNPSVSFFKGPWRVASRATTAPISGTIAVATASLPFAIAVGQRVWIKARAKTSDNRLSPDVVFGPITVAA